MPIEESHVTAGKKLKNSLKKKKKMKIVARITASELEGEYKDTADSRNSVGSCGLEKDQFSSDETMEADNEDDVELCDKE